ncbi:hypothetical protein CPZ06_10240, partial [Lactobacillus acidophilus]
DQYTQDLKTRRMFASITENMQNMEKQVGDLLALASGMRNTLGTAALLLAQIEANYVNGCAERRRVDALAMELQTRLADLTGKTAAALVTGYAEHKSFSDRLSGVQTQADRIANDRFVKDDEKGGPLPGVEYVGLEWFMTKLSMSRKVVENRITNGALPEHDAVDDTGQGRPKFLWAKHNALAAVARYREKPTNERGRAAAHV